MKWTIPSDAAHIQSILGKDCEITIEPRPHYCDRGNFLAKIFVRHGGDARRLGLDDQDGWPRYFFDEARAKAELEAWLIKRQQVLDEPTPDVDDKVPDPVPATHA